MPKNASKNLDRSGDFYLALLRQMPGLFLVSDMHQKLICSNDYTAKLFGYKDADSMLGISPYDMHCAAVECADQFTEQDKMVQQSGSELVLLDIHKYADGHSKIFITKKKPFLEKGKIQGCICLCTEITSTTLINVCSALIQSDKKYYSNQNLNERSYTLGRIAKKQMLSVREMDCLFYLLRGKTMKEIANILLISPRTVETYLESIKAKFHCTYKSEIVEYALTEGYLSYIPNSVALNGITHLIHDVKGGFFS